MKKKPYFYSIKIPNKNRSWHRLYISISRTIFLLFGSNRCSKNMSTRTPTYSGTNCSILFTTTRLCISPHVSSNVLSLVFLNQALNSFKPLSFVHHLTITSTMQIFSLMNYLNVYVPLFLIALMHIRIYVSLRRKLRCFSRFRLSNRDGLLERLQF